jgi:hypothetical protein
MGNNNRNNRNGNNRNNQNNKLRKVKNPDPMSNATTMQRYALKLIKDMAYGNFDLYTQGKVFEDKQFMHSAMVAVYEKLEDLNLVINSIVIANPNSTDVVVNRNLHKYRRAHDAYQIAYTSLYQAALTGNYGHLLVMINKLPPYKFDLI